MKRKMLLGSFTVEATFIVPLTAFIILALLLAAVYLYDTAVIQSQSDLVTFQASTIKRQPCNVITGEIDYYAIKEKGILYSFAEEEENEQYYIETELKNQIDQKSLFVQLLSIEALLEQKESKLQLLTKSNYNYIPVLQIFNPNPGMKNSYTQNYTPTEFVRAADVAIETASDIKGADKWNELFKNVMKLVE